MKKEENLNSTPYYMARILEMKLNAINSLNQSILASIPVIGNTASSTRDPDVLRNMSMKLINEAKKDVEKFDLMIALMDGQGE